MMTTSANISSSAIKAMPLRLLFVEDDETRIATFKRWLPSHVRAVWATNAGRALGILKRDVGIMRPRTYDGIFLDYDLTKNLNTEHGDKFTGRDVMMEIIARVHRSVPIIIHSNNKYHYHEILRPLVIAGFPVDRIAWRDFTEDDMRTALANFTRRSLEAAIDDADD